MQGSHYETLNTFGRAENENVVIESKGKKILGLCSFSLLSSPYASLITLVPSRNSGLLIVGYGSTYISQSYKHIGTCWPQSKMIFHSAVSNTFSFNSRWNRILQHYRLILCRCKRQVLIKEICCLYLMFQLNTIQHSILDWHSAYTSWRSYMIDERA